jgi:hypothetical protein
MRSYVVANVRRRCSTPTSSSTLINRGKVECPTDSIPTTQGTTDLTAARYAIKRLKSDLSDISRARGAIDLAIEVKILTQLNHPNIGMFVIEHLNRMLNYTKINNQQTHELLFICFLVTVKLRGYAAGPLLDPDFIIDRLYEILNHRVLEWKQELRKHHKNLWQKIFSKKSDRQIGNDPIHDIMVQRLIVAYDLASAFAYMNERQ